CRLSLLSSAHRSFRTRPRPRPTASLFALASSRAPAPGVHRRRQHLIFDGMPKAEARSGIPPQFTEFSFCDLRRERGRAPSSELFGNAKPLPATLPPRASRSARGEKNEKDRSADSARRFVYRTVQLQWTRCWIRRAHRPRPDHSRIYEPI